jgi:hypothetical protein
MSFPLLNLFLCVFNSFSPFAQSSLRLLFSSSVGKDPVKSGTSGDSNNGDHKQQGAAAAETRQARGAAVGSIQARGAAAATRQAGGTAVTRQRQEKK